MGAPLLCIALAALVGSAPAWAQPAPPPPPAPPRAAPPAPRPAPPPPARPAPPPARPTPPRPAPPARPPAPAVIPAPAPVPEPTPPPAPTKGSHSGLPLPRFAAIRSDEAFLRAGPGPRYPVEWVYKRRDLPVEIEREFDVWRLVRDSEGVRGWINTQILSPRRIGVVMGAERVLRRDPRDDAAPVARLKPGVLVRLRSCAADAEWCQASIGDYRGWIRRSDVWGTYPGEAIQ